MKPNPQSAPDGAFITITGTVTSADPAFFNLDYGSGIVTVEMDGLDGRVTGHLIRQNDQVTVRGRIDNDLFEATTIEAASVRLSRIGTTIIANAQDEEGGMPLDTAYMDEYPFSVAGKVIGKSGRLILIENGEQALKIDTSAMEENPIDDIGLTQVDIGDRIMVSGEVTQAWWEERTLVAESILELTAPEVVVTQEPTVSLAD